MSAGGELSGGIANQKPPDPIINFLTRVVLDWDLILRMGNSWYDRIVMALGKPAIPDQQKALATIDGDLEMITNPKRKWAPTSLFSLRHDISNRFGCVLVALVVPAITAANRPQAKARMRFDLTKLALSLAAFRADHHVYPEKLEQLSPKYALKSPIDIFSESGLRYHRDGDGYVLYSVGLNGKDDGGRSADDDKEGAGWDDIVVRIRKAP